MEMVRSFSKQCHMILFIIQTCVIKQLVLMLIKESRPCLLCLLRAELFVSLAVGLILQFSDIHNFV